jgi:hypothetical protein
MGLDVYMWKEEVLERDSKKGETVIKKTDMFWGRGWELGKFMQENFELDNCVGQSVEPEEALESLDRELKDLDYQPSGYPVEVEDGKNIFESAVSDYKEQIKALQEAVAVANKDTSGAEYQWELWW